MERLTFDPGLATMVERTEGTGEWEEVETQPTPKPPGDRKHRWGAMCTYQLSEHDLLHRERFGGRLQLGRSNLIAGPTVGCLHCEQTWEHAKGTLCPGEPTGYSSSGEPQYA